MKQKIPMLAAGGTALFAYNIYKDFNQGSQSDLGKLAWENFGVNYMGYAGSAVPPVKLGQTVKGMAPVLVGIGGSMLMSKLGMNKYLSWLPYFKW